MRIKPVLVPDHTANDLRRLMDHFADASTGPTRQQLTESRAAVTAAQGVSEENLNEFLAPDGSNYGGGGGGDESRQFRVIITLYDDSSAEDETAERKIGITVTATSEKAACDLATTMLLKSPRYDGSRITNVTARPVLDEQTMSRAAKGYEKYGKAGMQALAKAGREGRALDPVRDRYDRYDEAVAEGSAGAELKAIDGDYYEDSTDFFSMFDQDHFDREEESEDGMEIRGYIDDVCVMVFKFSTPDRMGGWGNYDDSALIAESGVEDDEEEGETCPECDGAGCPECYGEEDRDRAHDHAQGMERESVGQAVQESLIDDDSTDIRELLNFNLFRDYQGFKDGDIDDPSELQEYEQLFAAWGPVADQLERQINKAAAKGAVLTPEQNQEINDNWYDGSDAYDDPLRELPGIYGREIPIIRKILRQSIKDLTGLTEAPRDREDDERHDLDPSDWYIVIDGKLMKASVYPNQHDQARAEGFSPTREQARARAANKGMAEGVLGDIGSEIGHGVKGLKRTIQGKPSRQAVKDKYRDRSDAAYKAGDRNDAKKNADRWERVHNTTNDGMLEAGQPDVMRHRGDTTVKVVKRGGKPIGEIGIDAEASPGNGQYYVKLYDGSYDAVGFDTAEEALAELKYAISEGLAEVLGTSPDRLMARTGMNLPHKFPRAGQTNLGNIPGTNLPDSSEQTKKYGQERRANRPDNLKAAIRDQLGKHNRPDLPESGVTEARNNVSVPAALEMLKDARAYLDQFDPEDDDDYFDAYETIAAEFNMESNDSSNDPLTDLLDMYEVNPQQAAQMLADHLQSQSKDVTETADGVKYGVFAKGGSVGSQRFRDDPLKTFDTKKEAIIDARRRRSALSPGERGYYRMGYVVKPIKGDVEEGMIDNIKNTVRAANYDRLARRSNSQAVAGGGFAPPAQFKSLSAKGDQRAQKAQDIRKGSAEQVDEIDMGLVGDAVAGAALGLGSVGVGSYIGHKIGNKIGQKFIDRSNRKEAERRAKEKQDRNQQVDEKSEAIRHGNNSRSIYHVDESVDPVEQLRADIKRFAQ